MTADHSAAPVAPSAVEDSGRAVPHAYFERFTAASTDEAGVRRTRVSSTVHAQGAWRAEELHMAAASGLLVHEISAFTDAGHLRIARLSYDILGTLWAGELDIETKVVRPGRTIELVESTLTARGRAVLICRAWLLSTSDTAAVQSVPDAGLTPREQCAPDTTLSSWDGGFIAALHGLAAPDHAPGHGRMWLTTELDMVAGEPTADLTRLIGLADTANGIAPVLEPRPGGYFYPNVDLQIHLYRAPAGSWLGLANQVTVGADGIGLTSSVLHDETGPFAHAEQILTVRAWPQQ